MNTKQIYIVVKGEAQSLEEALIQLAKNVNNTMSGSPNGGGLLGGVSISNWHVLDTNKTYFQAAQALYEIAPPEPQDENYFTTPRIDPSRL